MKATLWVLIAATVGFPLAFAEEPAVQLAEPWQSAYTGSDATGKHVIGLWKFDAGKEGEDSSGHGRGLKLQGAEFKAGGRFGGCLESFRGHPVEDKRHQAAIKNHPDLSPKGAFTLEMWIKPKPELNNDYPESFLLDKKYASQDDYQLVLGQADGSGTRLLRASLGFGADSSTWHARPLRFEPGMWYHIAFVYDGAGTGCFYVNGAPQGTATIGGRTQVSAGKQMLSVGDRIGSYYHGFPGFIDEVRICNGALEFRSVKVERVSQRACFVRMESDAAVSLAVTNLKRTPLAEAEVTVSLSGIAPKTTRITNLAPGKVAVVDYPLDTGLRADLYHVSAQLALAGPQPYQTQETFDVRLVPRPTPQQFPVLMWGVHRDDLRDMTRLKRVGFTHALGLSADYSRVFEAGAVTDPAKPENAAEVRQLLDNALANGMTIVATLSPGAYLAKNEQFQRVNRKGQTNKQRPDVCGLLPGVREFCYNVGASVGKAYAGYPAFSGALIHTEVRDHASPCFHPQDLAAYRKLTGQDVPLEVVTSRGVDYTKLRDFPASRVIPDNHPLYVYYRWYWKQGDGWNDLNTAVHRGLKSVGRKDLWTFHDPAVRVARVYGSGGEVDFLSQWTYSYPDPIRIGVATDELLATVGGAATKQQVMKMTQIIWYRSQTAPQPKAGAQPLPYQATWEREQPEAPFITIAPMHLREALWTKIARPIKGIMYHGWGSLFPVEPKNGYRFTNPQTHEELARLTAEVIRPLGPTLLSVPGVKSDVAFLESFASEMFAGRGTYGWGGSWLGDAYHAMLYAHLQPEIVFDETITERGLDGFRVLVMADCDVITQSMYERIKAFQAKGGLIVGDDRLTPAITPDIRLTPYKRIGRADVDKAALLAVAAALRKQLDAKFGRYVDSSNPEVIPYRRRHQDTDYVFVVNDRREFGQYVGQHGLVMENGLPSTAVLSVQRPAGFIYDLVESRPIPARQERGRLLADIKLGPCDGRLYMVTSAAIGQVRIVGAENAQRGAPAAFTIEVVDLAGRPLDAVVPLEVTIRDAEGRTAEFSGYYAAVDGKLSIVLDIAANDTPGVWPIEVRELASGRHATHFLRVLGSDPWPPARKPIPKELANPVQPKG